MQFVTRLRAEGLPIQVDPVFISFMQKHLVKVNTQRCLRLTTATSGNTLSSTMSTRGYNYSQQAPQNHLLTLSIPPIKEINYTNSTSTVSGTESGYLASYNSGYSSSSSPNPVNIQSENFLEKPRGLLVAHLHEHRGPILKICPLTTFKGLFATCTREDVRIWDAEKMEGKNVANRSRCNIKLPGDKNVANMAYATGSSIIGVSDDKELYGFRQVS